MAATAEAATLRDAAAGTSASSDRLLKDRMWMCMGAGRFFSQFDVTQYTIAQGVWVRCFSAS